MLSLWTTRSWYPASLTQSKIEPQLPSRTEMLILLLTQATTSNRRVGPNTKFPDMRFLDYCSHVFHPPCLIGLPLVIMNALHLSSFCGETHFIRSAQKDEQPSLLPLFPKCRFVPWHGMHPRLSSNNSLRGSWHDVCAGCWLRTPFLAPCRSINSEWSDDKFQGNLHFIKKKVCYMDTSCFFS